MATKRDLGARVEELENDLVAAIAVIDSAVHIIVSLNKIIIDQDEIITSSEAIAQQGETNPKGLSRAQMASLVKSFKEFPKQRWVKARYLELRAEGKKKGKAIKAIVKEMKTPEMRDQFGAPYHPDHIRRAILNGLE